jgi:hypothetical protein
MVHVTVDHLPADPKPLDSQANYVPRVLIDVVKDESDDILCSRPAAIYFADLTIPFHRIFRYCQP